MVEDSYSAHFHLRRSGSSSDGAPPVEGLRMSSDEPNQLSSKGGFWHIPVLRDQVAEIFADCPPGIVIDATLGGGGHTSAILSANTHLNVLGMDRDSDAIRASTDALAHFAGRVTITQGAFDELGKIADSKSLDNVSGVLFDLGVSSYQLDSPERGFSFRLDGPLDMRMDRTSSTTAADIVNSADAKFLAKIFASNGEPVFAMKIARAIVGERPIVSTAHLAEVVRSSIPARARRTGGHPATRIFQALRIAVNSELESLSSALRQALEITAIGGRVVVISYHSGEDRIVKSTFAAAVIGGCKCPQGLPCACGAVQKARLVFRKPIRPARGEIENNPRSSSALLRAVEITHGGMN